MMSFWEFSNAVYAAPQVADECLSLQDRHGIDVNILLFCAYAAVIAGVRLTEQNLRDIDGHVAELRRGVIVPLRVCRRSMKEGIANLTNGDRQRAENLRSQVKDIELAAERLEQERLVGWLVASKRLERCELAAGLEANLKAFLTGTGGAGGDIPFPSSLARTALTYGT